MKPWSFHVEEVTLRLPWVVAIGYSPPCCNILVRNVRSTRVVPSHSTLRNHAARNHFLASAVCVRPRWQPPGEAAPRVIATTVPAFIEQAPAGPGSKPIFEERMLSADVRVHRNLAQAWAHYSVRFGDRDLVATWRGMDAFTLMWSDGRWK